MVRLESSKLFWHCVGARVEAELVGEVPTNRVEVFTHYALKRKATSRHVEGRRGFGLQACRAESGGVSHTPCYVVVCCWGSG